MPSMELMEAKAAAPEDVKTLSSLRKTFPLIVFFLLLWSGVIMHLRSEWSYNPQYNYGWMVPLFAAFFLWRRWPTRPTPAAPGWRGLALLVIAVSAFVMLLLEFV